MPEEEGEYHTNDPLIEASTSDVRKRFYKTIQEIKYQGQSLDSVEAFLVNTQDMNKLCMLFHNGSQIPNAGVDIDGQVKMYGVKIIESPYVPEGTIFKVFKNQDQMQYPVSPISEVIDVSAMGHPTSGIISSWNQNVPIIPGLPSSQMPDYAYKCEPDDKEDEKKEEPVETRHSTKRRIELDE